MTEEPEATVSGEFYRVDKAANSPTECSCDACALWTILYREYGDTEDTELGQSWQGTQGKETAEDVCSLMNMAYEQALEFPAPDVASRMLIERLNNLCMCLELPEPCLYCETRETIEAQSRTLRLAQDRLTLMQAELTAVRDDQKRACLALVSGAAT